MILKAAKKHDLDLPRCILIGDKKSDIEAGWRAGVGTLIRVSEDADIRRLADTDLDGGHRK